jgi:DNA-binding NarL/FixJ family response regulator
MPVTIVIYDDHTERRESLSMFLDLTPDFKVVGVFSSCSKVVAQMAELNPMVVLMDIQMPVVNGLEGVKLIKQQFPTIHVIMQTVFEDDDAIFNAIQNGASGYILKRSSPQKLIDAINDVLEGGSPMTPSIATKVLSYFRGQHKEETNYSLTPKEKEILLLLVDGLSYKMIADKCVISFHTVNAHIKKIYEKLQVHSVSEAVSKAIHEKIVSKHS